jgi:hypothetical protein
MSIEKNQDRSNSFREKLISSEPVPPERLRRLEEEILQLTEHRLSKRARIWWSFGLACSILFAGFGGFVAIASSIDLPLRIVWWLYTIGNVFVVCFASILLRRGRGEPRMFFWFGVGIVTLAVGCFVALLCRAGASPSTDAAIGVGFGEFCVLIDLILFLYGRVAWAHLSTQEHLLRLELLILDSKGRGSAREGSAG